MLFINLPVTDLERSLAFYTAIGFRQNTKYTSKKAAMMCIGSAVHPPLAAADPPYPHPPSTINVMLLTRDFFQSFLPDGKRIADAQTATGMLLCLSRDSREDVDLVLRKAADAGADLEVARLNEMEGMYGRSFADPDGVVWQVMWMSEENARKETPP